MPNADSPHPTPASGLNRRHVLTAGTAAAAGALSTAAAVALPVSGMSPSPKLLRWRAARSAYMASWAAYDQTIEHFRSACSIPKAHQAHWDELFKNPVVTAASDDMDAHHAVLDRAVDAILHRPMRSWHDVAELAEVVQGENRWLPGERDEDDVNAAPPELLVLFDAIATMARKGGGHG